jgi:hypothetical protein
VAGRPSACAVIPAGLPSGSANRDEAAAIERYRQLLNNQVRPHVGQIRIQELKAVDLNELYAKLLREGRGERGGRSVRTASQLIAAGIDVLTISRRLGHASPTITLNIYGHLFSNTDDRAAQVMEVAFAKTVGTD